ncbi:RNA polymerase sigma-70 factor [Chitinophagaceae bacterium LWZ2-11]
MTDVLRNIQLRISTGDEHALAELYKQFHVTLLHFAKSILRSSENAEEAVEDVFVSVWRNKANIAEVENLRVYLYVATKNRCLRILSQKTKELITAPFDYLDIQIDEHSNPHTLMVTEEMFGRMKKAVDTLPPKCKMIFKLVREDGLKYKDVAEILSISVNTIDAQMAIAVKRICAAMQIEKPGAKSSFKLSEEKIKKS